MDFGASYAARAKSVRLDLALIGFAGRLRDDQHSRLASIISTTKVETVHPHRVRIAAKFLGLHDVTTTIELCTLSVNHQADMCNHI